MVVAAIHGAGDATQAQTAALHAHARGQSDLATTLGTVVATAALAAGTHLTTAAQAAGVTVDDYDPAEDDPDSPDAWVQSNQNDLATGVQHHTGRMLASALAAAMLHTTPVVAMALAADDLYNQWTGQNGDGDYALRLAGDLVVLGWGLGELWAAHQGSSDGAWTWQKTWNAVGDAKTRPEHADADGTTVNEDENFTVGGEELDAPGSPGGSPAMTANCRCWLTWAAVNNATGDLIAISVDEG